MPQLHQRLSDRLPGDLVGDQASALPEPIHLRQQLEQHGHDPWVSGGS